ncbi:MAG TPA: ROK family protein, partial [Roseiarcus sp.]|nr:ROK family protein [Roseiarcus sp.]
MAELDGGGDDGIVAGLVELMRKAIAAGFDGETIHVAAVGVGVCGLVDDSGSLQHPLPRGIPGGRGVIEIVGAALGVPVAVDNDANMAALGELRYGAGRGFRDFVLITLGTNIGMGLVTGRRILHGARGGAGEGGLMLVPARSAAPPEDESGCRLVDAARFGAHPSEAPEGYAFIEELVGGGALARALSELRGAEGAGPEVPLRVLAEAAAADRDALSVVDRAIEGWAYIIANSVALFDPEAIILSGGLAEEIGPFLEPLRRRAVELSRAAPLILRAELGGDGGLIGASTAALALLHAPTGGEPTISSAREPEGKASVTTTAPPSPPAKAGSEPDVMGREIGHTVEAVRQTFAELQRDVSRRLQDFLRGRDLILLRTGASLAMARSAE